MRPRFFLQILPLAALGVLGTGLGLQFGGRIEGPAATAVALAVALSCFFAARAFRSRAAWMAAFIAGLSLAAGVLLARLPIEYGRDAALAAVSILLVAGVAGRLLRKWWSPAYTPLWLAAWLLVAGLIGLWLAGGSGAWTAPVAAITALTFAALSAAWFARLPPDPLPAAAMDLYLLGFNLFLVCGILLAAP